MSKVENNIDTTPSSVATNALQAIPFGQIIGGPLSACVDAQREAALTTVNFINEIGLTDKDGNKEAVYVKRFHAWIIQLRCRGICRLGRGGKMRLYPGHLYQKHNLSPAET